MQNAKKGDSSRQQLTLSNSLVEAAAWPSNDCPSVSDLCQEIGSTALTP